MVLRCQSTLSGGFKEILPSLRKSWVLCSISGLTHLEDLTTEAGRQAGRCILAETQRLIGEWESFTVERKKDFIMA